MQKSVEGLGALLQEQFEVLTCADNYEPHSAYRDGSVRILAQKKRLASPILHKDAILQAYTANLGQDR